MTKRIKVIGQPGFGKTTELKKQYLKLLSGKYKVSEITIMTFRKSAAKEIRESLKNTSLKLNESDNLERYINTIHSICYNSLGIPKTLESKDYAEFVKDYKYTLYLKNDNRNARISSEDLEAASQSGDPFDLYAWCRNTMTEPEKWFRYPSTGDVILPKEKVSKFFADFDEYKSRIGKIDYSDMLQQVIDNKIMIESKVLIVDEFQDLTPQMYAIFEMWSAQAEVVIIAGDPYQSIYSFFGATPDFLLNWQADTIIYLEHSYRLPKQIKDFSHKILRMEKMVAKDITTKTVYGNCITKLYHDDVFPVHETELHLVRANYQIGAIALRLAWEGKVFGTLKLRHGGWTDEEVHLANAIILVRTDSLLSDFYYKKIVKAFPAKLLDNKENEPYKLTQEIINILKSSDPTSKMTKTTELFKAKINGVKNRKKLIEYDETKKRRVMTIHGSKGLEAYGVFLHTAITKKIRKAIVIPGTESQAEARVWYVGCTRAIEHLYLVQDNGKNYEFPTIPPAEIPEPMSSAIAEWL
jgi:DNA helicase-2/ATP-dependent DNA helicase PcrA